MSRNMRTCWLLLALVTVSACQQESMGQKEPKFQCGCLHGALGPKSFETFLLVYPGPALMPVVADDINGRAILSGEVDLGTTEEVKDFSRRARAAGFRNQSLTPSELRTLRIPVGLAEALAPWPNNRVPFDDSQLSPSLKELAATARLDWANGTDLQFERATSADRRRITFVAVQGTTCSWNVPSYLLIIGQGYTACIQHEIGHALGLDHENKRFDRDKFITVHWENIESSACSQFSILPERFACGAYDLSSVMHYFERTFSCNGRPTITANGGGKITRKEKVVTSLDFYAVKLNQSNQRECRGLVPAGASKR